MTQSEIDALIARHGGLAGNAVAVDPEIADPDDPAGKQKIPNPNPTYKYVLRDGTHFTARASGSGTFDVTDPGTALTPPRTTNAGGPLSDFQIIYDPAGRPIKYYNPKTGQTIDLPNTPTDTRPPEPNVSTSASKLPVWNPKTGVWEWQDNPNYTPGSTTRPPEPAVSTAAPQIPKWDDATKSWTWTTNPNYKPPEPKQPEVRVIDNQLVRINPDGTTQVVYSAPEGVKFQTVQDGTILAIDPKNPTTPQVVWQPSKPRELIPGQSVNQGEFVTRDPQTGELGSTPNPLGGRPQEVSGQTGPTILQRNPDGSYSAVPNPAYRSAAGQRFQDLTDSIAEIHGHIARGEMTPEDGDKYIGLLRQNLDASLQGTTPYQQYVDRLTRQQQRMQQGAGLLNQRVQSGTGLAQSLLNSALGIVGNKNFMDPSAVAGFSPFAGAAQYVTDLGGGPDVYTAASRAVKAGLGDDPATALLNAALGPQNTQPRGAPAVTPQPSYGGLNIGSGAASNPQAPGTDVVWPLGRKPETAAAAVIRNMAGLPTNDAASALLAGALGG